MQGMSVKGGRVISIAPDDLRQYVSQDQPEIFKPQENALGAEAKWRFPAGAVAVVELSV